MRHVLRVLGLSVILLSLTVVAFAQGQTYTVQPGDNLFRIALRFNVSLTTLAQANNISNVNLIFVGQVLTIPSGSDTPAPTPLPGTPRPTAAPTQPPAGGQTYTVQRGDTLNRIAQRFGLTFQVLAQANNISNPNRIFAGQVLTIPAGGSAPVPTAAPPTGGNPPPNTAPITGFELGAHVFSFNFADLARGTGMTWVKQQIRYNQGDPASIAQGAIDGAKARGFRILLGVVGNPTQLAANPTQYYQDFANFLGQVARLGADGIEVWNEPNIDVEWPRGLISGAQYTQMLSAAYQSIKAQNSSTIVISGAPAPTGGLGCSTNGCNDDAFIGQMAAAGASRFMDCVGVHYNAGAVPPTATSGAPVGSATHYSWYYPSMVSLYTRTFPGKPLCFTEIGYVTSEGYGPLPAAFQWASGNSIAEQAEWLAGAVRSARQSGVVRLFIVWNLDSTNYTGNDPQAGYAIIRADGTCPACNAIGAVMR
jgi:LysM repeat protein